MFYSSTVILECLRTNVSPRLKCSVMDCVFEEVFLIKSNAVSFDEKLRNPRAFIRNSISQTNLGCISYGTEKQCISSVNLNKGL